MAQRIGVKRVRTLFISDLHLRTAGCEAELLLDFLQNYEVETIYLVGDIVDGWGLRSGRSWPRPHLDVIAELAARAREGARLIYIPGNHDESVRRFVGLEIGGIEVAQSAIHENADGRRYLVLHGDQLDLVVQRARWLAFVGNWAYRAFLAINVRMALVPRRFGSAYGSLSPRAKLTVNSVVNSISHSAELLAAEVRWHEAQGVVCGHTHHPVDCRLAGVRYLNTGDWVTSCTGVVEYRDGRLEVIRWAEMAAVQTSGRQAVRQSGHPGANDIPVAA